MRAFNNFAELVRSNNLKNKDILFWVYREGKIQGVLKRIVGITYIPNDILLHLVSDSSKYATTSQAEAEEGVTYVPLSKILTPLGFEVRPSYKEEE